MCKNQVRDQFCRTVVGSQGQTPPVIANAQALIECVRVDDCHAQHGIATHCVDRQNALAGGCLLAQPVPLRPVALSGKVIRQVVKP